MLNELYDLNTSMEKVGIKRPSWHKDYKTCPKNKTFFLLISRDGTPCDLQPIADLQRIQKLRKYEVANGISFPAFNIQPLLHARTDRAKSVIKKLQGTLKGPGKEGEHQSLVAQLDGLWEVCDSLWLPSETDRIEKCLQSAGLKDKLSTAVTGAPPAYSAFQELLDRLATLTVDDLQRSLTHLVRTHILEDTDSDDWIETLLVSTAKNPKKASLVFELADSSTFPYPVNHPATCSWVNAQLMGQQVSGRADPASAETDAYGRALEQEQCQESFPAVNLPQVGKVILRAMSSESPCQKRYARVDSNSFPASKGVRQSTKDALEWLCHRQRQGATWADASGACGFTKRDGKKVPVSGLLLVYPSSLGESPPQLAGFFFTKDDPQDPDGAKFETAAARVTSAMNLMVKEQPNVEVRVFVLAKADKARTKLLVSKKFDAPALISGAAEWQAGCENIPLISLNIGTKGKPQWLGAEVPFPGEVVRCLSVAWFQGGEKSELIHGLTIGEGIALLLASKAETQRIARRGLHVLIDNASPLLLALGQVDHRRSGPIRLDRRSFHYAKLMPSLLGLLLYKLNCMKGEYMRTAPFLVGRFLALADLLHKEYCRHVRSDQLPPQLIGNGLMPAAMGNPEHGLARLLDRLRVYQAWANTARGEDIGLAKWALKQMGCVSDELADIELPNRTNDSDKAQMLLGYLARIEDQDSENGC